jgi:hypothetical protein
VGLLLGLRNSSHSFPWNDQSIGKIRLALHHQPLVTR